MNLHINHLNHQVVEYDGQPLFVLVPYQEYLQKFPIPLNREAYFPHEVVESIALADKTVIQAWREYRKLSTAEVALRLGIPETTYLQLEKMEAALDHPLLAKIATILNVEVEQLTLED